MGKLTHEDIETIQIHIEEDLYPHIAIGAMDREAARFLATHPQTMRKWREDLDYFKHIPDGINR